MALQTQISFAFSTKLSVDEQSHLRAEGDQTKLLFMLQSQTPPFEVTGVTVPTARVAQSEHATVEREEVK